MLFARLMGATWFLFATRVLLTFVFWSSGLEKLGHFSQTVAEMRAFDLPYPVLTSIAVIVTQLGGSILIILNRQAWLGAGALSAFTALTIVLVHRFWALPEPRATQAFYTASEHVSVIGALAMAVILSAPKPSAATGRT